MVDTEEQKTQQNMSNNQYYTSTTALQIRLSVEPLLAQLEMDIRGIREYWDEQSQEMKTVQIAEPMFTEEIGIQNFLSYVRSVINTQIVQGNLDEDSYADYMCSFHSGLAEDLIINKHTYGLKDEHYPKVIRIATNLARGFLTRPIKNLERESYANTIKSVESSQLTSQGKNFFNLKG